MYKLVILPDAKSDIKKAARWYSEKQQGLGMRFTSKVRERMSLIQRNPKVFSIRYEETRTAVIKVFPFMIHKFFN